MVVDGSLHRLIAVCDTQAETDGNSDVISVSLKDEGDGDSVVFRKSFEVAGYKIVLYKLLDGTYKICQALCPHLGFPMLHATVKNDVIICTSHRYKFAINTGECLTQGAFCDPLIVLDAVIDDDWVCVDLNSLIVAHEG